MNLAELTRLMHEFVESKGWNNDATLRPQTPKNLAISLSIEAAEVLEHFQWKAESGDSAELAAELADVQLYLLQLASVNGIDLEKAVLDKLKVNHSRTWDQEDETKRKQ